MKNKFFLIALFAVYLLASGQLFLFKISELFLHFIPVNIVSHNPANSTSCCLLTHKTNRLFITKIMYIIIITPNTNKQYIIISYKKWPESGVIYRPPFCHYISNKPNEQTSHNSLAYFNSFCFLFFFLHFMSINFHSTTIWYILPYGFLLILPHPNIFFSTFLWYAAA